MYISSNHHQSTLWVDFVGIAVLGAVVLAAALYLLWCCISKLGAASSPLQAGVFRLAAARGDIHTMACLAAAGVPLEAASDGFTALLAACVHGQVGEQWCLGPGQVHHSVAKWHSVVTLKPYFCVQKQQRGCAHVGPACMHKRTMAGTTQPSTTQHQKATWQLPSCCWRLAMTQQLQNFAGEGGSRYADLCKVHLPTAACV
jgi:hypothetical protein